MLKEARFDKIGKTMSGVIFDSGPFEVCFKSIIQAMKFTYPKFPWLLNFGVALLVMINWVLDIETHDPDWRKFVNAN